MSANPQWFPLSTRSQVWDICITYIRVHQALQPVKTWMVWEGDAARDTRTLDEFTQLPVLRITPECGESKWIDEISHTTTLRFVHEFALPGTRITDLLDFWSAIESAWFDGTGQLRELLKANNNALREFQITATGPVGTPMQVGGGVGIAYKGTITLYMDITTGE